MTWAATFRAARGSLTQEGAAIALSGPSDGERCPVATVRDWEQGRNSPPRWQQWLYVGQLLRAQIPPKKRRRYIKSNVKINMAYESEKYRLALETLRKQVFDVVSKPDYTNPEEMVRKLRDSLANTEASDSQSSDR